MMQVYYLWRGWLKLGFHEIMCGRKGMEERGSYWLVNATWGCVIAVCHFGGRCPADIAGLSFI